VSASDRAHFDWVAWHAAYEGDTPLRRRLEIVQQRIRECLERAPSGPIRVVSVCAGQGRDLLGALADHPRRADVRARLVERDPANVAEARAAIRALGLSEIEVAETDAGTTDAYVGAVPADLVLVCGVFGNVTHPDIEATIAALPSLCAPGATVLWTRHRAPPDATPGIRDAFARAGFQEISFDAPEGFIFSIGSVRLLDPPARFVPGRRLFHFVGYMGLAAGQRAHEGTSEDR
jgi:hypothetical protein